MKKKASHHGPAEEYAAEMAEELGFLDTEAISHRLPAILTRREVRRLMRAPQSLRDQLIIRVLYATGIRVAELAELCWCDVLYDEREIFIRGGKGDKDRYVLADNRTFTMLAAHQGKKALTEHVFDVDIRQLARLVKQYGLETGVLAKYEAMGRSFSCHSFRHYAESRTMPSWPSRGPDDRLPAGFLRRTTRHS